MKIQSTALLGILGLTTALCAQTSPVPAPAHQFPAMPATPAPAPVDPAKLALAREVIKAMQADRQMETTFNHIKKMVTNDPSMLASPSVTAEQKAEIAKLQAQTLDMVNESYKEIATKMEVAYAEVFSTEEMEAIKAFYASPVGAAMVAKQPQLMQRLMPIMQHTQGELMQKIRAMQMKLRQEFGPRPSPVPQGPLPSGMPPIQPRPALLPQAVATTPPVSMPVPSTPPAK
jgi:hypothetical protein